ncbi:MAG: hypothetical protein ACRC62_22740 [Microcoleus sp.]
MRSIEYITAFSIECLKLIDRPPKSAKISGLYGGRSAPVQG